MTAACGVAIDAVRLTLGSHRVFRSLDLHLAAGNWHALLGPSGAGKSSLLRMLAGLQNPDAGCIRDEHGQPLSGRVAYQSQEDNLLPWLNVIDNVQLGPRLRGTRSASTRRRAQSLLEQVGLGRWQRALPCSLSGGMRQRVALARTLLDDRPVVLLDEPFARLDAVTRDALQALSWQLLRDRTVLLVTHDPLEALRLAHVITVLQPATRAECVALSPPGEPLRHFDDPSLPPTLESLWQSLRHAPAAGQSNARLADEQASLT